MWAAASVQGARPILCRNQNRPNPGGRVSPQLHGSSTWIVSPHQDDAALSRSGEGFSLPPCVFAFRKPRYGGRPLFAVSGGTRALQQTINIDVMTGADTVRLAVPTLRGALVLKGAAYVEDQRDRGRHAEDAVLLLACLDNADEVLSGLSQQSRRRLRAIVKVLTERSAPWVNHDVVVSVIGARVTRPPAPQSSSSTSTACSVSSAAQVLSSRMSLAPWKPKSHFAKTTSLTCSTANRGSAIMAWPHRTLIDSESVGSGVSFRCPLTLDDSWGRGQPIDNEPMHAGVGDFLRERRSRLSPEDLGLHPSITRRRVAGLRREELAELAGVSLDYYVRLEQGRTPNVSESVLLAIGRVLRLSAVEQEHLGNLARHVSRDSPSLETREDATLVRFIDMATGVPALILSADFRVLAANALARAVFDFSVNGTEVNLLRLTFLDPSMRERIPNLEVIAAQLVAHVHLQHGRNFDDASLGQLIAEMLEASPQFAQLWQKQDVTDRTIATLIVDHPVVGKMEFTNVWMTLPSRPGRTLVSYTVEGGSLSASRLEELASMRSSEPMVQQDHARDQDPT